MKFPIKFDPEQQNPHYNLKSHKFPSIASTNRLQGHECISKNKFCN